ncbi:CBS domain-containing protein [Methanolobus sp. ZRKC3]|uniref:CBS domain-containing protein n=1 Tax=Methanolobus sp. ZRKC3 TaxID=3125786 RepID=UPI00324D65BD
MDDGKDDQETSDTRLRETKSLSERCELISVSDIMTQDAVTVRVDDSIDHVMEVMVTKSHHSYPVLDENNELKGIVDQDNILELLFFERNPRHHHTHLMAVRALSEDVRTLMIKHPITVPHDMNLCNAADLMIKHHVDRMCVVKDGKLAGIISKEDMIKKVFELRRME